MLVLSFRYLLEMHTASQLSAASTTTQTLTSTTTASARILLADRNVVDLLGRHIVRISKLADNGIFSYQRKFPTSEEAATPSAAHSKGASAADRVEASAAQRAQVALAAQGGANKVASASLEQASAQRTEEILRLYRS